MRLEEEVKVELDGLGRDPQAKKKLLQGEMVALAEKIEATRTLYNRLRSMGALLDTAPKPPLLA